MRAVDAVVAELGEVLRLGAVVALKSTVPVGTTASVEERLRDRGIGRCRRRSSCARGNAVHDFRHPDRVVVGATDDDHVAVLLEVLESDAPTLSMTPESAELTKYASNAFLRWSCHTRIPLRICVRGWVPMSMT